MKQRWQKIAECMLKGEVVGGVYYGGIFNNEQSAGTMITDGNQSQGGCHCSAGFPKQTFS
jgi:hypothetical protein